MMKTSYRQVGKIAGMLLLGLCCFIFSLETTGGEKSLYKILPEDTIFIYEQFERTAITEKDTGISGTLMKMLDTPTPIPGMDKERLIKYLNSIEKKLKKVIGLKCRSAFAIFADERSSTYLKITIPIGGMPIRNAPGINIPIGFISTSDCENSTQWNSYKEYLDTLSKQLIKLYRSYLGMTNFHIKAHIKKFSDVYSTLLFELSDPTQVIKLNVQLYTYITGNTIISSSSKQYIKKFIKGTEGTLYKSEVFKREKELLSKNTYTAFWWFNFQKLYTGIKNIAFQFIPPMMAAEFFKFEADMGLAKIATFSGFQDNNKIWKERINLSVESALVNTLLGESNYDKDFVCADIDTKNTLGFTALNLTTNGVLSLIEKIKSLIPSDPLTDKFNKKITDALTKYLQNGTFTGNLCAAFYSKEENNESAKEENNKSVYRIAVLYKVKEFSPKICEEIFIGQDCSPEKNPESVKVYNANTENELTVWADNSRDEREVFSKAKSLLLVIFPINSSLPQGNSDSLYREVMEKISDKGKNLFDTPVALNINIKSIINALKKEQKSDQRFALLFPPQFLEIYEQQLGENLYIKVKGTKNYIEFESNVGGASFIAGVFGVGLTSATIPAFIRRR